MNTLTSLKPFKTKKEIADELGISVKTLTKKLKKVGYNIPRGLIPMDEQKRILNTLGINRINSV